jgi:hypothetical protein
MALVLTPAAARKPGESIVVVDTFVAGCHHRKARDPEVGVQPMVWGGTSPA